MDKLYVLPRMVSPVTFPSLSPCTLRLTPCCNSSKEHLAGSKESFSGLSSNSRVRGWRHAAGHSALVDISKARLVETEAPLLSTEILRAGGDSSFEMEAAVGRPECEGRGCRAICDGLSTSMPQDLYSDHEDSFNAVEARAALYTSRRATKDLEMRPNHSFSLDFAEFANDVFRETAIATKYFDIAMKKHPNDAATLALYAQFAWKTLVNLDKADDLFQRAIEESSMDSDANAAYALFLWQTED